jgi:putative ABC transport system permease protein
MQAARTAVRELDPRIPPNLRTLDEIFARSLAERRFSVILLGVFGTAALVLAVMGIYGVVSYLVAQRTREIGIRMALGARPGDVAGMVVRGGLGLSIAGVAVGLVAAGIITRLMTTMLYEVEPLDAVTFISVPVLLALAALVASYVPARRAAGVEPVEAMRTE